MRITKSAKTRKYVIERIANIFNKKGYKGTSISDITNATKLTKGSIYGNFVNKEELAVEAFKYNTEIISTEIEIAFGESQSSYQKIIYMTEFYRKNWIKINDFGGCPLMNAAIESDDALPFLKTHVQESISQWIDRTTSVIEEGQNTGEFNSKIDARLYAEQFLIFIEGGIMLAKILNNKKSLESAINRLVTILDQEIKA